MEYDSQQAVAFAMSGKPVEFEDQVKLGLSDRILDAIEAKRVETASKIFGTPEYFDANAPEEAEVETPAEAEDNTEQPEAVETPAEEPSSDDDSQNTD